MYIYIIYIHIFTNIYIYRYYIIYPFVPFAVKEPGRDGGGGASPEASSIKIELLYKFSALAKQVLLGRPSQYFLRLVSPLSMNSPMHYHRFSCYSISALINELQKNAPKNNYITKVLLISIDFFIPTFS